MILAEFEKLVRTPADVERLNGAILELAVRGRLVAQDAADEPASALLVRIRAEKQRLEAAGEIRKSKPLAKVKAEEMPFALPDGWVCCRFGEVTFNRDGERIPLSKTVREGRPGPYDYYGASGVIDHIDDYLFDKSLLLIGEDGANLVNRSTPIAFIAHGKYWVNNHAHVLDAISLNFLEYLAVFINATDLKPYVTGTAQPKMNQAKMNSIVVPLPPLAEQQRIVERVESLLARTAALKESLAGAQAERETLAAAALHRLENAVDPAQASAAWALIRENFAALIDTPASVAALKQTILQLAVQGKLVAQNPADEPAAALLARIRAEKQRMEEAGEIRKSKPLAKVKAEEMPFDLPEGWVWTRLGETASVRGGKRIPKGYTFVPGPTAHIYIRVTDMKNGSIEDSDLRYIDEDVYRAIERYTIEKTDLYITIAGTIGQVGEVPDKFHGMNLTENAAKISPYLIDRRFLRHFLNSPFVQRQFDAKVNKMAQPKLALIRIQTTLFPLPPLAEQQRIVERVEALFALCDGLAAELSGAEATRQRWVGAVLAGVG
ncbi:MAG: restriction endonuclease subunit S [Caldilineaceae bacterium]|nr:restriction endonuclease subunit S [Caldilineaceae bacterium]